MAVDWWLMTKNYWKLSKICIKILRKLHHKLFNEQCNKQTVSLHRDCVVVSFIIFFMIFLLMASWCPSPFLEDIILPVQRRFRGVGTIFSNWCWVQNKQSDVCPAVGLVCLEEGLGSRPIQRLQWTFGYTGILWIYFTFSVLQCWQAAVLTNVGPTQQYNTYLDISKQIRILEVQNHRFISIYCKSHLLFM